jgi:hypothetical protein
MSNTPAAVLPTKPGSLVEGAAGKPLGLAGQVQIVAAAAADAKPAEAKPAEEKAAKAEEKAKEDTLARAKEVARRGNAARQAWAKAQSEKADAVRAAESERAANAPLRERIAKAERLEAMLRSDPLAALQELGVKAEDAYKRAVLQGKPEALIAQLREELATERQAREQFQADIRGQQHAQQVRALEADFLRRCGETETYPALANTPPSILLKAAVKLGEELFAATKQGYTNQELLAFLNQQYAAHQKASAGDKAETGTKAASGAKDKKGPATSRTVSNDLATQSWSKPANWQELGDLEQRRLIAEQVKGRLISKRT